MSSLNTLTISATHALLRKKEISVTDIAEAVLQRIESVEEKVKAFITINREDALKTSEEVQKKLNSLQPENIPFVFGIPFAIKDNICTKDILTTCASKILYNFVPPYESTATSRLKEQGYILIGKTNLDEFAMGSSTENSGFQKTLNPWDIERVPGGSSGGSAAAVAADECIAALGSDTGGSIRQPACFCGIVGLKPTYGRVSRFGLIAYASSLDQIGTLTKDVRDSAIILNIISGHDPFDSTSAYFNVPDFTDCLGHDIKGLKMGIPKEYFVEGINKEVEDIILQAIKHLESLGAIPVEISLPHTEYAIATYYILATSEASSNLARYDGVKYGLRAGGKDLMDMYLTTRAQGFGTEVKRRIMLGTYALSSGYYEAYYRKAQQVRTLIKKDFEDVFTKVDIIVTPTSPTPAFKVDEKTQDPLQMYLTDIYTISMNLAGVPAMSVPCGFTSNNLPVGIQFIGKHFDEETIFKIAYAYEQSTDWHRRKPQI